MKFDDLMSDYVGDIGAYQICVVSIGFIFCMTGGELIATNFVAGFQDHWCKVEELLEFPHSHQKYVAIPIEDEEYVTCDKFDLNYSSYTYEEYYTWNRSERVDETTGTRECSSWVYDQSHYVSTITSEWDLVCGDQWLLSMVSTIYFFGFLVGVILCGGLSDWQGRLPVLILCTVIRIGSNLMSAFSPNYIWFAVARFLMGFSAGGGFLALFVVCMEIVGSIYRPLMGSIVFIGVSTGYMVVVGVAYAIRDHYMLQLVISLEMVVFILYFMVIPESPRWLIIKGKYKKALKQLKHMASVNNNEFPENLDLKEVDAEQNQVKKGTLMDIFRSRRLRTRAFIVDLHWFTDSLVVYGLSLNTGYLHGDIYVNTLLMAAVEIPANILCTFTLDWKYLGRRLTCALSLIFAGLVQLIIIPILIEGASSWTTALSLVGKFFATMGFLGIYVYSSELFPTEVRNVAMGQASMFARISGMIAPFIGGPLSYVWIGLPQLVFGFFGILAGSLVFILPETLGTPLVDTIKEAEEFSGKKASTSTSLNLLVAEQMVSTVHDGPIEQTGYKPRLEEQEEIGALPQDTTITEGQEKLDDA